MYTRTGLQNTQRGTPFPSMPGDHLQGLAWEGGTQAVHGGPKSVAWKHIVIGELLKIMPLGLSIERPG